MIFLVPFRLGIAVPWPGIFKIHIHEAVFAFNVTDRAKTISKNQPHYFVNPCLKMTYHAFLCHICQFSNKMLHILAYWVHTSYWQPQKAKQPQQPEKKVTKKFVKIDLTTL